MRLKQIRKSKKYSQQTVADYICCSSKVYARYEAGTRQPSIDILCKLAEFFGVSVDYIIGRDVVDNSSITEKEAEIIKAVRNADERAQEDAITLLTIHKEQIK